MAAGNGGRKRAQTALMLQVHQTFDEIRIYEGEAERTGNTVSRDSLRHTKSVCRSMTELARKVRRNGDGVFYLVSKAWPENAKTVNLLETWTTMG